jgi:hypothetical protein
MVLANICVVVGALLFGGGIIKFGDGSIGSFFLVAAAFAGAGVLARSWLLTVLAVLALSSCLGATTGYVDATYFLGIQEPTLTVLLFTIFSIGTYELSKHLAADYQGMAIAASRTSVFLVNFGFWIGSLWGDREQGGDILIADWVFCGPLGDCVDSSRRLGLETQPSMVGQHGSSIWWHTFLHAVVRAAGRISGDRVDRRSACAWLCDWAASVECPLGTEA